LKLSIPLGADKNVCPLFVKHHPDALDMLPQFCMGDLRKNREVNLVGQQQVVKFLDNGAKVCRLVRASPYRVRSMSEPVL